MNEAPIGSLKARVLLAAGFDKTNAELLEQRLLEIAHQQEVSATILSPYGTKYVVAGAIQTPTEATLQLITVWIIDMDQDNPRFITAYPQ